MVLLFDIAFAIVIVDCAAALLFVLEHKYQYQKYLVEHEQSTVSVQVPGTGVLVCILPPLSLKAMGTAKVGVRICQNSR